MPKAIEDLSPEDSALFDAAILPHVLAALENGGIRASIWPSATGAGCEGDGVTDDLAALTTFAGLPGIKFLNNGNYKLSAEWKPGAGDNAVMAGPAVTFTNNFADYENLVPYQSGPGPIWSQHIISRTYGSAWAGAGNIFQIASHVTSNVASAPVVAVFGQGRGQAALSKVWGGNFVSYADNATATAIGIEINCGVLTAGGSAYGLAIASAGGGGQPLAAVQIQSNNSAGQFVNGIDFNWRSSEGLLTGTGIRFAGGTGATAQYFIRVTNVIFTLAEIETPSFIVAATPATVDARIQITASTGTTARVGVNATSADASVQIRPKGTGQAQLADSSGNVKVAGNATGIGFNGTSPVAKPSISGSRGGNAALASLLTALASMGLVTDGSSA